LRRSIFQEPIQSCRDNLPWFLSSAVLVAISQAFVYASLAVAPLVVVTPILQLSLIFQLFLSQCINRDFEVMNAAVLVGALTAVLGSILVSLDTDLLMKLLDLLAPLGEFLRYRLVCIRPINTIGPVKIEPDALLNADRKCLPSFAAR
jgi:hypothetical protein